MFRPDLLCDRGGSPLTPSARMQVTDLCQDGRERTTVLRLAHAPGAPGSLEDPSAKPCLAVLPTATEQQGAGWSIVFYLIGPAVFALSWFVRGVAPLHGCEQDAAD